MAKGKSVKTVEALPEIDVTSESVEVKAEPRKIKTGWEVEIQKPELTFEQLKNMSHQNIKKYYEE